MSRLTIYKESDADSVTLSNRFIDEYLAQANDAQIKVYLYLLRMVRASIPTSISDIADKFNHTERDVERALSYWDKLGLIHIEYDAGGEICALQFPDQAGEREQPLAQQQPQQKPEEEGATILPLPVKRDLSRDELGELLKEESFCDVRLVTETYFGHPLTTTELKSLGFIYRELGFSEELLEYLIEYCVMRNKRTMRYVEKVALAWHEKGVRTVEQARLASSPYEEKIYTVMKALGRGNNEVTEPEANVIRSWYDEYGFTDEIVLYACNKSVLNADGNRLKYTEVILKNWHDQGIRTMSQIEEEEKKYGNEKKKAKNSKNLSIASRLPQNQYMER
ncbi:MAG: DnaD domain protein, partial [Lachnospiraceae bacterium]|nr:DnaD domain protein [Lachnospiraceae bacterium]